MRPARPRRFPRLATQFTLVLLATLVFANLIAALLLAREGSDYDRAVRLQGDMGRLVALVGAIEEADPETGEILVSQTSTGFTRFSLTEVPLPPGGALPAPDLTREVVRSLPGHAVRVYEGGPVDAAPARRVLTLLSVRLEQGAHRGRWLNAIVYPLPDLIAWQWKRGFFVPLAVSFCAALAVGLLFVRRMTRPLRALAAAARAAGEGDREARLTEAGARELREAAAAFNGMQRRIADFDQERARLVAALGHDLRTPITALRIRAELVEDDMLRDDMVRILGDMGVMADDLLHFSGGLHGNERPREVDLAALLASLCAERGVPLRLPDPPGTARVWLRPVAVTRMVGNLLDNAQRYAGGARVALSVVQGEAVIRFEDDGPGIAPEALAGIREPFIRGEQSRCPETGGAGLGLSIAEAIVRDHGGRMEIANRAEGGLRVLLYLPLAVPGGVPGAGSAAAEAAGRAGLGRGDPGAARRSEPA